MAMLLIAACCADASVFVLLKRQEMQKCVVAGAVVTATV